MRRRRQAARQAPAQGGRSRLKIGVLPRAPRTPRSGASRKKCKWGDFLSPPSLPFGRLDTNPPAGNRLIAVGYTAHFALECRGGSLPPPGHVARHGSQRDDNTTRPRRGRSRHPRARHGRRTAGAAHRADDDHESGELVQHEPSKDAGNHRPNTRRRTHRRPVSVSAVENAAEVLRLPGDYPVGSARIWESRQVAGAIVPLAANTLGMLTQPLLTEFDVRELLHLSPRRLNELIEAGEIPHIKLPTGDVRFDHHDLADWTAELRLPPVGNISLTDIV